MDPAHPPVLIAAPRAVFGRLSRALAGAVEVIGAETSEEAIERLQEVDPQVIIVCYVFDEMRPFRLLRHLQRERPDRHVPTLLVRAVPVELGASDEADIAHSYLALGVDEFINLHDEEQAAGREAALQRFRDSVLSRLAVQSSGTTQQPGVGSRRA